MKNIDRTTKIVQAANTSIREVDSVPEHSPSAAASTANKKLKSGNQGEDNDMITSIGISSLPEMRGVVESQSSKGQQKEEEEEEGKKRNEMGAVVKQQQRKKHTDPQVLKVRHSIQVCCKTDDLLSALLIYKEAQACGIWIEPQTYYCLLALCDGFETRGLHIGTPRPSTSEAKKQEQQPQQQNRNSRTATPEERKNYAFEIKQAMDNHKISFTETAYTSLVRVLCKARQSALAEQILTEAESATPTIKLRLRIYSAVIQALSQEGQMLKVVSLWKRMISRDIHLSEREYAYILKCAVSVGNAEVVDRVLADLAEDVLVPSHETTRTIIDWFSSPYASSMVAVVSKSNMEDSSSLLDDEHDVTTASTATTRMLGETTAPSIGPIVSCGGWIISNSCRIDTKTGMLLDGCLANCFLHPVELSSIDRLEMMRMNETIVMNDGLPTDTSVYAGGGKGRKRKSADKDKRTQIWESFKIWLETKIGSSNCFNRNTDIINPYEVVVDGANVGYYKQNYANAPKHVDYNQIDWVVRHFQKMKKRVLLVLHERHFSPKLMPEWAIPITKRWERSEGDGLSLFRAPAGCNDDWFWLHAALRCGKQCMVVTNDEMRDHHFQMLAYRSFLRWKERHQIRFSLGDWVTLMEDNCGAPYRCREVKTYYPDVYSRRIQRVEHGIVVPLPKKGDEDRFLDGSFVSEDDSEEETYLCIGEKTLDN